MASKGFQILAFPCNQFGHQEPGTNQEIHDWAKKTFDVQFPMFEKIDVNGDKACDVYNFLRNDSSELKGATIRWNFGKFLVNGAGRVVNYSDPTIKPLEMFEQILSML